MFILLAAASAGELPVHDALLARFDAHFSDHAPAEGPSCLTGLVRDLKENWDGFTPDERRRMTAVLAPWTEDLLDPVARPTTPPPPGGAPTDTCVGQQGANRLTGAHFSVEWDTGANEATAQEFLDALESAYEIEINQLGWREPAGLDQYLMLAYIQQGNSAGAYTTVQQCGREYVPYIVAYAGSFQGSSDWYETMALHEFNHASQFSYGYGAEFYLWEATATYIEEQVAPDNNWWSTYVVGYTAHPEMAINAESQSDYDTFYHMYGMSTWFFYVDQYQAGTDAARQMWEWVADNGTYYDVNVEDMAEGIGIDFAGVAYPDFVARNAAIEYDEPRYWQPVDEVDKVSSLPATGESSSRTAPGGYGQNYIRFQNGAGDGESTLVVTVRSDESVEWLVELIQVSDSAVTRAVTATGEGEVRVELPDFGEEDVMLAISPLKHNNRSNYAYAWEASLEAADPDPTTPGDDTGTPDDGAPDDGEKVGGAGTAACGCTTGGGEPAGLVLLGLTAALVGRRRRR